MKFYNSKRNIIVLILIFLLIVGGGITLEAGKYIRTKKLCEDIKNGIEINTNIGNSSTAPLFFDKIATILQIDGPKIPLIEACYYRNVQAVHVLLENGANPNVFIEGRWSPLEAAIMNGSIDEKSLEIVQLLIEFGADVDAHASDTSVTEIIAQRMVFGNTSPQQEQILKILVNNGASIACDSGATILQPLVRGGNLNLAEWLLEQREIDINEKGYAGGTALMRVAALSPDETRKTSVVWLLDHGADIHLKDDYGKSAYDYAVENGHTDILELLK